MPAAMLDMSSGQVIGPAGDVVASASGAPGAGVPDMPGIPCMPGIPSHPRAERAGASLVDDALAAAIAFVPSIETSAMPIAAVVQRIPVRGDVTLVNADATTMNAAASSTVAVSSPTRSASSRPLSRYHAYAATVPANITEARTSQPRRAVNVQMNASPKPSASTMKNSATVRSSRQCVGTKAK